MKKLVDRTNQITGTAILAVLVIIFDYSLTFSGFKLQFPWMPFPKFDFTGIPIVLSFLLFGLTSAATTSIVACLGIVTRSGDLVGGVMKAIAEFSTVLGMVLGLYLAERLRLEESNFKGLERIIGISSRIIIMSICNLIVLPSYYGMVFDATIGMLPSLVLFNATQGTTTVYIGFVIYELYMRRVQSSAHVNMYSRYLRQVEDEKIR